MNLEGLKIGEETIPAALGISEERTKELEKVLESVLDPKREEGGSFKIVGVMNEFAKQSNNVNELCFLIFQFGKFTEWNELMQDPSGTIRMLAENNAGMLIRGVVPMEPKQGGSCDIN